MQERVMRQIGIGMMIGGAVIAVGGLFIPGAYGATIVPGLLIAIGGGILHRRASGASWWRAGIDRVVLVLASLIAIPPAAIVLWILAVFVTTHVADLYDRFAAPPPGQGIVMPEDALPDDDALATLHKLGEPIHQGFESLKEERKGRYCGGLDLKRTVDRPCMEKVLQEAADPLAALDAWMAGPSRHTLERPANLGQHLRVQGIDFKHWFTAKIPNYLVFKSMAQVLAYRAILRSSKGDQAGAQQDLRTLFALGAFLQQNPLLIGQVVGVVVQEFGVAVLDRASVAMLSSTIETILPSPQAQMEGIHYASRIEYRGAQEFLEHLGEEQSWLDFKWNPEKSSLASAVTGEAPVDVPLPFRKVLGLYSLSHTQRLLDGYFRVILTELEKGNVVNPMPELTDRVGKMCNASPSWLRNPVGREMACSIADINLLTYVARTGRHIDQVEATKVVLAARRYHQKEKKWPAQETDLVPAYLPAWPVSALDRQPLRWMADKRGLQMLKVDGKTLCLETEPFCLFRFEPPTREAAAGSAEKLGGNR